MAFVSSNMQLLLHAVYAMLDQAFLAALSSHQDMGSQVNHVQLR